MPLTCLPGLLRQTQKNHTPHVAAAVLLAHAAVLWLAMRELPATASAGLSDNIILASVVTDTPALRSQAVSKPAAQTPSVQPRSSAQHPPRQQAAPVDSEAGPSENAPGTPAALPALQTATGLSHPGTQNPPPAQMVMPASDADYLNNPPPAYPRMSRRMGEQGTVIVRAFINTEGRAEQTEVRTTSGHPRLDEAALEAVRRWRYAPGKRAGVPEAMWFNIPIRFVLN